MRAFFLCLTLAIVPLFSAVARADEAPALAVEVGEVGLEGQVQSKDDDLGQMTILATAFTTPAGRKEINPPKLKTLVVRNATRYYDERLDRDSGFGQIKAGLTLRVVGRDTGSGKPLTCRLVLWRSIEPGAATPPTGQPKVIKQPKPAGAAPNVGKFDPDTPDGLTALLPPLKDVDGVKIRIFNAGFDTEKNLFNWNTTPRTTFFLAFRVIPPPGSDHYKRWFSWVSLLNITGPNHQVVLNSGNGGLPNIAENAAFTFPKVDPQWKSAQANFEVISPDAPEGANGRFTGSYNLKGTLPTPQNPRVEPKAVVQTARGTIYTLNSIVCDYEKKTTTLSISTEYPPDVPDAQVSTTPYLLEDDLGNKRSRLSLNTDGKMLTTTYAGLPAPGATEITLTFQSDESALSWKKPEYFQTVSLELPVAAIAKAYPPPPALPDTDGNYTAKNELLAGRLDEVMLTKDRWYGTLWIKSQDPAWVATTDAYDRHFDKESKAVEKLVTTGSGNAITADKRKFSFTAFTRGEGFFYNDGTLPPQDARPADIQIETRGETLTGPLRLEIKTVRFKDFGHVLDMTNVAVPPDNTTTSFEDPQPEGSVHLEKVAFVQGDKAAEIQKKMKRSAKILPEGALVLVFKLDSRIDQTPVYFRDFRFQFGKGAFNDSTRFFTSGDLLSDEGDKSWKSLVITNFPATPKTFNFHAEFLERVQDAEGPMLVFEDVDLSPKPTTPN